MLKVGGAAQSSRVLVTAGRLEEPDPHTQPRHDLFHAVPQHQGCRAGGAGDSACRHGHDRRLRGRCWQTAIADVGPAGTDKGDGGRFLILPPDHVGGGYPTASSHCHRRHISRLRCCARTIAAPPIRHRQRGGVRETRSGVSTLGGGRATTDRIHRRDRCLVRRDDPATMRGFSMRLNSIVQTEPWLTRDKSMVEHVENHRHRKGTTVYAGRQDATDLQSSRPTRRMRGLRTGWKRRTCRRPTSTDGHWPCRPPTRSSRE